MAVTGKLPLLLLCFLFLAGLSASLSSAYIRHRDPQQENPFYYHSHRFQIRYRNDYGIIRILSRFDRNNRYLDGLENYRLLEFQARPQTFLVPHHSDAEFLIYVASGEALMAVVHRNNRESYRLERDDVLRVPAGATLYVANRDYNQNLRIVKLAIPVNTPGQFADFFPGGKRNPQSYYDGFSKQTLQASFDSPFQEILRAFLGGKRHSQGQSEAFVKASREQIRQLSQDARSSQQEAGQSKSGPFNLRNSQNLYSNNYGRFWEAHPYQLPQLRDLNVSVTLTELNRGALFLPHANSRATVVAYVAQGQARLEIAAPRNYQERERGQEEEQEGREQEDDQSYGQIQSFTAELNEGDVFAVPAGYPFAVTSSNNNNLRLVGFDINVQNNQRNFFAGEKDNVIAQISRVARELTFGGSTDQVEKLLKNQRQSHFASAQPQHQEEQPEQHQAEQPEQQQQQQEGDRSDPLSSILSAFV